MSYDQSRVVEALRAFVDRARAETDEDLPPMASGAFGYVGYDMIQHVEPVKITKPDMLNVPEVLLVIPRVVIVFDHIYQEILLIGRVSDGNEDAINILLDAVEQMLERLPVLENDVPVNNFIELGNIELGQ